MEGIKEDLLEKLYKIFDEYDNGTHEVTVFAAKVLGKLGAVPRITKLPLDVKPKQEDIKTYFLEINTKISNIDK